nr:hypothetical protein [uncultured Acetatifactor sp.]
MEKKTGKRLRGSGIFQIGGTLHGMELWNCLAAGAGEDMGEEH